MTTRPAPRKSGRVPRSSPALELDTLDALHAALSQSPRRHGPRSRHLSQLAADLELAIIERRSQALIDSLCIDVAATALRIRQHGDRS
jgi:hypothetical protein